MERLKPRNTLAWSLLGVLVALLAASQLHAAEKLRLKPGARGRICVECHDGFEAILKKRFVHTPLAKGDCSGCHNPHTSRHEMLLAAEPRYICYECHDDMLVPDAQSAHQVFVEGKCASCHDPHAADNKMILVRGGSELCFECHAELGERIASIEFPHDPVEKDCLKCHNPHISAKNPKLLKDEDPALCIKCHKTGKQTFKRLHENYPVQKGRCSSCHDPHGSNTEAILFDNVHEPVSDKECGECHGKATAAEPFALKDTGFELCEGCHYETVAEAFNQARVHWPLVDKQGCINCHAPHASREDGLLKQPMLVVCGECHADTVARQERSEAEHPPIAEGECGECHAPHGSDNLFILNEASSLDLCGECHEWQTHSSHPIGEEIVDPRNENVTLECLSCHRSHGTEYKHLMYFETTDEQCVQCHLEYRR
jgi:predicted CXXCH cytochrome family protein